MLLIADITPPPKKDKNGIWLLNSRIVFLIRLGKDNEGISRFPRMPLPIGVSFDVEEDDCSRHGEKWARGRKPQLARAIFHNEKESHPDKI